MSGAVLSLAERQRLWRLEAALDETRFAGAPPGVFVNDLLVGLQMGRPSTPAKDLLRLARVGIDVRPRAPRRGPPLRGRVLVTWIDRSDRFADLVLPVVEALGDGAVVLAPHETMVPEVPAPAQAIAEPQIGPDLLAAWLKALGRSAPGWYRSIRPLVDAGAFPRRALPAVGHLLALQTRRYLRYRERFRVDPPCAVLVEYDRGRFASPIVLAARQLGIPTATLVHGALGDFGYTPLLADRVFCWGEVQADRLAELGIPPARITVTGCPRIGLRAPDGAQARASLDLDERPLLLLATNRRLAHHDRLAVAQGFLDASAPLRGRVQRAIRPHPRESIAYYAEALVDHPDVQILDADRAAGDQVLAAVDLVVAGQSAFVDEATIAGVPVVLFESGVTPDDLLVGLRAANPLASSTEELGAVLDRWSHDTAWREGLEGQVRAEGSRICAAQGRESGRLTAQAMQDLARRSGTAPARRST